MWHTNTMFEDQGFDDGDYDVAQVCRNGHAITDSLEEYPHYGRKHCPKCGLATISKCPHCDGKIRGHLKAKSRKGCG